MENHPTRGSSNNPNLYRWKNWEEQTPFAPSFDIPVYIDQCGKDITHDLLYLLSKKEVCRDVRREKWLTYNLFDWDDFVIGLLCDRIYQVYEDYMRAIDLDPLTKDKIWIRGWGVVLGNNEFIPHHSHSFHENTYLSGNLSLSDSDTTTDYLFPYLGWYFGYWKVKNIPGKMVLFPSWLEHRVTSNQTGKLRFSLGFDMFTEQSISYIRNNRNESSELQKTLLLSKRMDLI